MRDGSTRIGICLLGFVLLNGCGSSISVREISYRPADSTAAVDGVPFRMEDAYRLRVFKRKSDGTYEQVHVQDQILPDPDRLYALSFKARRFADNTLKLDLREDGTLSAVNFTSKKKFDEAIAEFGKQGGNVAEAYLTREDVARAKELERLEMAKKVEDAQRALLEARAPADPEIALRAGEDALEAALQALITAENAQAALDNLPRDATEVDRIKAQGALRLAQLQANHAFRRAKLEPQPYPGVF